MNKDSDTEKELLKVLKLNQDKSINLKREMEELNTKWEENNQSHEEFLRNVEKQLNLTNADRKFDVEGFVRESEHEKPLEWDELIAEADEKYDDKIGVNDLLTQEEIARVNRHMSEIDAEFEKATGLNKKDIAFLLVAVGLQCIRQYVIDPWMKANRSDSTSNDEAGRKKNADAGWYYVPTENIMINRVPFDTQNYNHENDSVNGFLKGAKDHRYVTLGHDPILGWIFGTANILTSTITRYDMQSAHVKNDPITKKNYIYSMADTGKIFNAVIDRWNSGFKDGKVAIALAVVKEAKHLHSDINTKDSLPLPGIMYYSPSMAENLANYGIDMAGVGTEAVLSGFINWLIAVVHKLCFDREIDDEKMYEVRTRKIILYSNFIASTSNVLVSCFSENAKILDVGGLLVTISHIFTDVRFICKIKDEFVERKLDERFEEIKKEVDELCNI